jgi:methionyl-tRNA formyltransferase
MTRAVVFAYHDVGCRCLQVLLAQGVEVPLVVTHVDATGETIWFDSVAEVARAHDIPVITPDDPNVSAVVEQVGGAVPDFLFSFYYRRMLKPALLDIPARGALNMHGSLLPKYRGRVPVNWAVIHGERETGASLHYMTAKPDQGDLVDQFAVPILPDDRAIDVFRKVVVASELVLHRSLPKLLDGTAPRIAQDLARGSYFGGRCPEDGRIDWSQPAASVHNLVRGVAPPYPGAFCTQTGHRLRVLRSLPIAPPIRPAGRPAMHLAGERCCVECGDGGWLWLIDIEVDGTRVDVALLARMLGHGPIPLTNQDPHVARS